MFRRGPVVSPCYILGLNLLFLSLQLIEITLTDFNVLLVLPTWIKCSVTTFLTDVSMWLSSFYKAITTCDQWSLGSEALKGSCSVCSWILNHSSGAADVIKLVNPLRLIPQDQRLINLLHFDDSIIFTKIDLADLGAQVLVHSKNGHSSQAQVWFFKSSFEVQNFPCFLSEIILVSQFVDDLFCPRLSKLQEFYVPGQDSFGGGVYPKTPWELDCTSNGLSCNFLDLAISKSPTGLSCDLW